MTLYLYKIGTNIPVLTVAQVQSYTAEGITALDKEGRRVFYGPLAEDIELSSRKDCTEALRAACRQSEEGAAARLSALEALMAELLFGGEGR